MLEAIVFAWVAIEALLNEQAYIEIQDLGHGSKIVYDAVERGASGFDRVQAILTYLCGHALEDGMHPANDLKLLGKLRNGIVHYKFRDDRLTGALVDLAQRGYLITPDLGWNQTYMAWTSQVKAELATWAYHTACDAAVAIADLLPKDKGHQTEASIIKGNFQKRSLEE